MLQFIRVVEASALRGRPILSKTTLNHSQNVRGLTLSPAKRTFHFAFPDMPAALPYSKHSPGRTFVVASSVLGLVALTQVGMLGWAFVKRVKAGVPVAALPIPANNPANNPASPVNPQPEEKEALTMNDPFEDPSATLTVDEGNAPIMPPSKPQPVPLARLGLAPESRLGEMLQQGRSLRERGDMSNALLRFREAYAADPRNPEAIAEVAVTLDKMGLPDKAAENWKRVFDMGESAGVYFAAAEAKMREAVMASRVGTQQPAESTNVQSGSGTAPSATFGLGTIETEELNDPKSARHLMLRVPIQLRLKTKISNRDLVVQVIFYELLDDKPVRINANVSNKWSSAPVDWREDETEVLEVEYNQPLPDGRDPKRENRKYYGFIARVYYKDELQATRAEPALLGQRFPAAQTLEKETLQ